MPSNKETLFQDHICDFLEREHKYHPLSKDDFKDKEHHIIAKELIAFITSVQPDKYAQIEDNYKTDTNDIILKSLLDDLENRPLWVIMRKGLDVKGTKLELYKPKPRSKTSSEQQKHYELNRFAFKKEYRYNTLTEERIDLVIWLNGLPIIVVELKHEDEGQNCEDAIHESFLTRNLSNNIYRYPFLYVASSNTEVKVATDPRDDKNFRWFNASLSNQAETKGEYPVEHLYRHALSKENIAKYLEHYLLFVPAEDKSTNEGVRIVTPSFTIFPRYHQLRASKGIGVAVLEQFNASGSLGDKYLINHSAGSGKTLTIAWLADILDSLYSARNDKVFDNIIILTDRRSLDKNIKDDLELFSHLGTKINFTKRSGDLAKFLEADRDIIVSTIHKFGHIQEKLSSSDLLKNRRVAFLIDEGHRSQDGKMAMKMRKFFTKDGAHFEQEEDEESCADDIGGAIRELNTSNQTFVAFTATTTAKTVTSFGEPFDVYSEEEAIQEGYILDVAQNIISYETLYNLELKEAIPEKDYPTGTVSRMLKNIAFNDDELIQFKSEVVVKLFEEKVKHAIDGKAKAMVVASSRPAGLKYFKYIKAILEEKEADYKTLFAFSDYLDPESNESIEESDINNLDSEHGGKVIQEVFKQDNYRIMVVANKFQTGFNQPLLTAMFLDKVISGVNAIQTVSRLNRKHPEKEQADILVVDFTNNSDRIFEAFNKHRKGSPYKECEPDPGVLEDIYQQIEDYLLFTHEEVYRYIEEYIKAEKQALERLSTADAILSNTNQEYRQLFKERLPDFEDQKRYVNLLKRYTKIYYFIAQFYELDQRLHEFIVFAEAMSNALIRRGKVSELKQLMKYVELSKGAVKYRGQMTNLTVVSDGSPKTGLSTGSIGQGPPRTTIEKALDDIKEKFKISDEEALVIREICEDVSNEYDIKERVTANKDNEQYLNQTARPKVRSRIRDGYIKRELWEKLEDPIYIDRGGIITLMGRTVIEDIVRQARSA